MNEMQYAFSHRILLVDDEPFNLQTIDYMVTRSLQNKGYYNQKVTAQIDRASDGQQAVDLVRQNMNQQPYGLILTDC